MKDPSQESLFWVSYLRRYFHKVVSNLIWFSFQKLVGRYKKTGPVTPAFIDDNADPVDGDQLNNPLKEK